MNIPKYWAKRQSSIEDTNGQALFLSCWQWSNSSTSEASQRADTRLNELVQKVSMGKVLNRYSYGDRPMREEITQSVISDDLREVAVVTRNAYGALVLNTINAMFIDIDFPEKEMTAPTSGGGLLRLFGGKPRNPTPTLSPEERGVEAVTAWAAQRPDLSLRIYRTFAGLRCLITNNIFEPGSSDAINILSSLGSDPLYARLCQQQQCFRARLTPKPWRCGETPPSARFPFDSTTIEARYRQWEQHYQNTAARFAACRLVKTLGPSDVHPDVAPVLRLHDRLACPDPSRALA